MNPNEAETAPTSTASQNPTVIMPHAQITEVVADAIKSNAEPFLRKVPPWAAAVIGIFATVILGGGTLLYFNKDFFLKYQENGLRIAATQMETNRLQHEVTEIQAKHDNCHRELFIVQQELSVVKSQLLAQQKEIETLKEHNKTAQNEKNPQ